MTIEAYAVGVAAKLEDGMTPPLLQIIEALTRANGLMLEFTANSRRMSTASGALGRNLERAAAGASRLGDSTASLTRASYILDTMAASSAEIAANMRVAQGAGAGIGRGAGGSGAGGGTYVAGGRRKGRRNYGHLVAGSMALGAGYGIYENAKLQDINLRAAVTSQTPTSQLASTALGLRQREFGYAQKYGFVTGGSIQPYAGAILESSRLLRTLPHADQVRMTNQVMPYAVAESYLKQIPLPEAVGSFIGLAHQAQAYTPEKAYPLYKAMLQASLTTHASLEQITRASSYAMPALVASGANAPDVLYLLATMMQAGILNTKSGTWLNAMAMNALPNTLGSGLFQNKLQNVALTKLGLYKNGKAQFYKNGHFDLMREVSLLAAARHHMSPLLFNAATRRAFGLQGQRAASLFSESGVMGNLTALENLAKYEPGLGSVNQVLSQIGTANVARQTAANAKMTLMNATVTFMAPVNAVLRGASSFFAGTAGLAQKHPVVGGALDLAMIGGAVGLTGASWAGGKALITKLAPKVGGILLRLMGGLVEAALAPEAIGLAAEGMAVFKGARWLFHKTHVDDLFSWVGGEAANGVHWMTHSQPQVHVTIDGHDVRHHVLHGIEPGPNHGTTGMNPLIAPLQPSHNTTP